MGLPSSKEEHASKVRKMRAQAQGCTCSGSEPAAQVRWSVHDLCCDSMPEGPQEAKVMESQPTKEELRLFLETGPRRIVVQETGNLEMQPWRVPTEFSFRLIRCSR